MKRIVLLVLTICMVALLGIGLSACNNATPQGQLANILSDHNHETFVYDVVDSKTNSTGTLTVKLDAYAADSTVEHFGTGSLVNVKQGILISEVLEFGDATYEMGCYYNLVSSSTSYMVPAYSYRIQTENNVVTLKVDGTHGDGEFRYDRTINGTRDNGAISLSGLVFDNNQFQQCLRSVTTFSSGLNLSFSIPVVSKTTAVAASMSASCTSSTEKVKSPYTNAISDYAEEGIDCYSVKISRSTDVAGVTQTLWYADKNITVRGWKLKNVLVKFEEPYKDGGEAYKMTYTLRSADLA